MRRTSVPSTARLKNRAGCSAASGNRWSPRNSIDPKHVFLNSQLSTLNSLVNFSLRIWRQSSPASKGGLQKYEINDISPATSFLEMLDILNEQLSTGGEEPIAFDSDCREGICGTCSLTINGEAHGPAHPAAVCQLYMRQFKDGATITVEPFRVRSFPI